MAGRAENRVRREPRRRFQTRAVLLVGAAVFVSGFVAMALEIVWFRHLGAVFGGFRTVLSTILTVILVGIWLGSLIGGTLHSRFGRPYLLFMGAQALLVVFSVVGMATVTLPTVSAERLRAFHAFGDTPGWQGEAMQMWIVLKYVAVELGVPALMMGLTYPLANAMIQDTDVVVGRRAGLLYLANTAGGVLGSLAGGFALLPALGMQRSLTWLAVIALVALLPVYGAAQARPEQRQARWLTAATLAGSLAVAGCAVLLWVGLPARHVVEGTIPKLRPSDRVVTVVEGSGGTFAVVDYDSRRALITNGHPMSSTGWLGQRYMRAFAHVPLLSMDAPKRVLVVAFGVGNTAHAASLHPSVERVDIVDTSPEVLRLASYFADSNRHVLDDPEVAIHVNDGRHHLRLQPPATYDLITLEPPPIAYAGVGSLYSQEFYTLAKSRLKPGGYVTQWLPVYQLPGHVAMSMVRAFLDVFPGAVLLSGSGARAHPDGTKRLAPSDRPRCRPSPPGRRPRSAGRSHSREPGHAHGVRRNVRRISQDAGGRRPAVPIPHGRQPAHGPRAAIAALTADDVRNPERAGRHLDDRHLVSEVLRGRPADSRARDAPRLRQRHVAGSQGRGER